MTDQHTDTPLPKILMVEDDAAMQRAYARLLSRIATPIFAETVLDGERLFMEHRQDLAIVVLDGQVPYGDGQGVPLDVRATTLALATQIRGLFLGPIIAAASDANRELLQAGCTHACEKTEVRALVVQLLAEKT